MANKFTVLELAEHLHARFTAPEMVRLEFGGCRIDCRTNSTTLAGKLNAYFKDWLRIDGAPPDIVISAFEGSFSLNGTVFTVKQPDPGKSKIKEEYLDLPGGRLVRKRLTGMLFLFGGPVNIAIGPCNDNDNQVINFINSRYIQWLLNRGGLLSHAAGVARNGVGLALAGFSGMGKSTLALHVLSRGADFVSNDRLVYRGVESGVTMYGIPKLPRINPGTALHNSDLESIIDPDDRERFHMMPEDELWRHEEKYDVFIDQCFGEGRFSLKASLKALVLLNWRRGGGPTTARQVSLAQRSDLLPAFTKSVGLFFEFHAFEQPPDYADAAYLSLLDHTPVIEISGGVDFAAAAAFCDRLLMGAPLPGFEATALEAAEDISGMERSGK